jgi:coenzyme PQQ precursor peptide PqqA
MEAGQHSQVLYSMFPFRDTAAAARLARNEPAKPLIPFRFVAFRHPARLQCNITRRSFMTKISLANFSSHDSLMTRAESSSGFARRAKMAWKAPKIVEVPCGMEINMYVSATRK